MHFIKNQIIEKRTLKEINSLEKLSEDEVHIYQNKKIKEIILLANETTQYYPKIFNENNINIKDLTDFKKIPFLTKSIIIENTSALLNRKIPIENLVNKYTGGSTGKPLKFYQNTESGLRDYAFHFHQYIKMGYESGDIILGTGVFTIPEELRSKNIYWLKSTGNQAFGNIKLSLLDLTETTIQFYIEKLIQLKPSILRGIPSLFDELARYILKNKIKLDFMIKGVSLTSEVCLEKQRINIEKAFLTKVYFEYGHKEIAVLCHSDFESYSYKSYPSYGYVEVLNENGEDTNIDEIGHIVVTGFLNTGMPFIRYRTEDMGRVSYRNGGVVHFSKINGRTQDYLITKERDKIPMYAITTLQHFDANINKWQIVQNTIGEIEIYIIKGEKYNKADQIEITTKIQKVANLDISFHYTNSIPRTKGGKHLFLIQKLKV